MDIHDLRDPRFDAVIQETRLRMLAVLTTREAHRRGGYSLQELGALLDCSPQNAHHHLRVLADAGVVRILREEPTQRIPRQFWVSELRRIRFQAGPDAAPVEVALTGFPHLSTTLERRLREEAERAGMAGLARLADAGIGRLLASLTYEEAAAFVRVLRERADQGLRRGEAGPDA